MNYLLTEQSGNLGFAGLGRQRALALGPKGGTVDSGYTWEILGLSPVSKWVTQTCVACMPCERFTARFQSTPRPWPTEEHSCKRGHRLCELAAPGASGPRPPARRSVLPTAFPEEGIFVNFPPFQYLFLFSLFGVHLFLSVSVLCFPIIFFT